MQSLNETSTTEQPAQTRRSWLGQMLGEHSGLVLTGVYVLLSAVGVTYNYHLFRSFGVSVWDYAETSDFLLAAFREPLVILLFLLSILLMWLLYRLDKWLRVKSKLYASIYTKLGDRFYTTDAFNIATLALGALIYGWILTGIYAHRVARRIKAGEGRAVIVELNAGNTNAELADSHRALLIGTTSNFIFLYYPEERRTHIVPVESISRMIVP